MTKVHEDLAVAQIDAEVVIARMMRPHRRAADKIGCTLKLKFDAETIIANGEAFPVRTVVVQLWAQSPRARRAMKVDGEVQVLQAKQAYESFDDIHDATNEVCKSVIDAARERL